MSSAELENLVKIGQIKREKFSETEYDGLVRSAETRLKDAAKKDLAIESRFDLAYNAAHALALAALRLHGYRSDSRYSVFLALPHTTGVPPTIWRVLSKAHDQRNHMEYEGIQDVDEKLVQGVIDARQQFSKRCAN